MKNKTEEFYVEIEDSVELRRQMLETSKGLIGILQQYEEMKGIDAQKVEEIEHFRGMLKDISSDIARLKSLLPKIKLGDLPAKETPIREPRYRAPEAEPMPETQEAPAEPEESSGTDPNKLESQLKDIEKKLQDLQ